MKIINQDTSTSELIAIKMGDLISNGIGIFGVVENIEFKNNNDYWEFTFLLVGGDFIQIKKARENC
jgi:hypothetical protein